MVSPTFSFTGLASGLDTNSLVESLMQLERAPITRMQSQRAEYDAKRDAWTGINTQLAEFRTALDDVRRASDFASFNTASSSDEGAISVIAPGSPATTSLQVSVEQLAATHQIATGSSFATTGDAVGAGSFQIDVGGQVTDIATTASTTLADLASLINASDAEVKAAVVQVAAGDHRLLLTANESGAANAFTVSSDLADFATSDTISTAADARIRLGDPVNGLAVTRSSNVFEDVVEGVTFTAHSTTTSPVTIGVGRDAEAAATAVAAVFETANTLLAEVARNTAYDSISQRSAPLTGDSSARDLTLSLRSALSELVPNAGSYSTISDLGVTFNRDGSYSVDIDQLTQALEVDYDSVVSMFGSSSSDGGSNVSVVSSTSSTQSGFYDVVVDTAPDVPTIVGSEYSPANQLEDLNIQYGGINALVNISQNSTIEQAIDAINQGLQAAGITAVLATIVDVPAAGGGTGQAIQLSVPGRFGSAEELAAWNDQAFGLNSVANGVDVAGSIGGEAATGTGDLLLATAGDPTGLTARVSATSDQVGAGGWLAGSVGTTQGLADRLDSWLDRYEGIDGEITRAQDEWDARIDDIDDSVEAFEVRMDLREQQLRREFTAMEQALAQLQDQGSFLTSLLPANTGGQ